MPFGNKRFQSLERRYPMIPSDIDILNERFIKNATIPGQPGDYRDFPKQLHPDIVSFLKSQGIRQLYSHQDEMFQCAQNRDNIIITTATASGKTMSFLLPVLNRILENPASRSLFVYPTKALTRDQFKNLETMIQYFGKDQFHAGVYDGDTPPNKRYTIRKNANIILTNPEMINASFLANHSSGDFSFIFKNLEYVVIDELHYYRGVFGSHLANLVRRMKRICHYYGSSPQFFASSATIANPKELAENVFSDTFTLINHDGAPRADKEIILWVPPKISSTDWKMPKEDSPNLLPELVIRGYKFIAFSKSRQELEIVLRETRERLKESYENKHNTFNYESLVAGYRGGYTPEERREIERRLNTDNLKGVIATNALELGIDIGDMDVVVNMGFPYTKASFFQQIGRAGRKNKKSYAILLLNMYITIDQFICFNPDWLLDNQVENAIINKDNLFIQTAHLRAAAAELPITMDDIKLFPDLGEILPVLVEARELTKQNALFSWNGEEFPAGDISLRGIDKERYKVVNIETDEVLTEMDETTAFREVHPRAIYIHDGEMYLCEALDLKNKKAEVSPSHENYYTTPFTNTTITPLHIHQHDTIASTQKYFADIKVKKQTDCFKKVQFHNHQNLGTENIELDLQKTMETEGLLLEIPSAVSSYFAELVKGGKAKPREYEAALAYVIRNAFLMRTMTSKLDVECTDAVLTLEEVAASYIVIYDDYIGGLGFAEKGYEIAEKILKDAIKIIQHCRCKNGCPACTGSYRIDKEVMQWALEAFFVIQKKPENVEYVDTELPGKLEEKPFVIEDIESVWPTFIDLLATEEPRVSGSQFLQAIKRVRYANNTVTLMPRQFIDREWILSENNEMAIKGLIKKYFHYDQAQEFAIDLKTDAIDERKLRKIGKRHNDLKKGS